MFPGDTRVVSGLRALQRRQTAPVKRKTDKCDKRTTDKCDSIFFFFYRQGLNAKHERKFSRQPINGLGESCFVVISPRGPDRRFPM